MTRIWDAFMFNDELDMLECRLTELQDIGNLTHVLVEANVTHQDRPKPYHYLENRERFAPWKDRIVHVQAKNLPLRTMEPDPWAREHAQREWIAQGLCDADRDDVLLQSDVDEIPTAVAARNVRPQGGLFAFDQSLHCFAVDWEHPSRWNGTVAGRVGSISNFGAMRDARNIAPSIPSAGWHLSWLGGRERNEDKLNAFCHPEIAGRIEEGLARDEFLLDGWHVDGTKMRDYAGPWPKWITERRCPDNWFRPRLNFREDWFGTDSRRALADLYGRAAHLEGDVVEVGCWEGCSTVALANAAHPETVHAVDTWEGSPGEISAALAAERDVFQTFQDNLDLGTDGNVRPHRMGWADYFKAHRDPVKFIHIDGEHTYEQVRDNLAAVMPLMVPGGIVCGDDQHHPPVRQAVLERFPNAGVIATLWWHQVPSDNLADEYRRLCTTPSDIYLHLPRLAALVTETGAQHVIELGTRTGVSTVAFLHALKQTGGRLTSIDIDPKPAIPDHERWTFLQGDDLDLAGQLDPAEIVFIDTSHHYEHTLAELDAYLPLVKPGGVIVCHDTRLEHPEGAPPHPRFPVRKAIEEFATANDLRWMEYPDCFGLGVIRKEG